MKRLFFHLLILLPTIFIIASPSICLAKGKASRSRLLPHQAPKMRWHPVLLEITRQDEILKSLPTLGPTEEEAPQLLPNRVYLVYSEEERRWLWKVTDFDSEFADPPEALRTLSVFKGSFVGAKNPNERYGLNFSRAIWVRTFQPEQQFYWVYSVPPQKPKIKTVTYQFLPTQREIKK